MAKLLIVTDAWTPQVNGVVTGVRNIAEALTKKGVDVFIVHPGLFGSARPMPLYPEIKVVLAPGGRLRELFLQEKPDYVHISTEGMLGHFARAYCLRHKIPFTTYYHTNFPLYIRYHVLFGRFLIKPSIRYIRWFHSAARAVFVATPGMKEELESQGHKNVIISPHGVDTTLFTRDEARIPGEAKRFTKPVFVYVGRVSKEKNIEEFLDLDLPGTKLVIGDGPQLAEYKDTYADTVHFVGYKKGQDLVDWLSAGAVCVFPSRTDTFGLVVVEALSCGIPVAAHDVLGPRDILTDGVDGVLSEDLKEAALRCLTLSREDCRKKALTYSWDSAADTFWENVVRWG